MTATKGFIRTAATTPLDTRKADAAKLVTNADGTPRIGILGVNPSIVASDASTAPMRIAVTAAGFSTQRVAGDGTAVWTNDGTVFITVTKPASQQWYVTVYAKHDDTDAGDADSLPVLGIVTGAAASLPTEAAIPVGALKVATVLIPSTATSTQSAGVVITNVYPMTAAVGGIVPFRTKTDMDAWAAAAPATPRLHQRAVDLSNDFEYIFIGTMWRLTSAGRCPYFTYHKTSAFNWPTALTTVVWDAIVDGALDGWTYAGGVFTCVIPGVYEWDARTGIVNGSGGATANVRWYRNGAGDRGYGGGQAPNAFTSHGAPYRRAFAVGDTVELKIVSTAAVAGILTDGGTGADKVQLTWLSCRFAIPA